MTISTQQLKTVTECTRDGLRSLERPPVLTGVEWADTHFYMSSESSYQEGRWVTLPFQRAILNSMCNDRIKTVNVTKSARVGYTKLLMAANGYFAQHKKRNILLYLPTDGDAENFMKSHVESAIRDVPVWRDIAPWYGKKHRDNTLQNKRFTTAKNLWVLGGAAAKNYREKSPDIVEYDELAAFEPDIEKEGSPTFLGDKRIEGSIFPKSIRGSTPKIRGKCLIEKAASESPHLFEFYLPCPHCGEMQVLRWGGKEESYGFKWDEGDPSSVFYLCSHHACVIRNQSLMAMQELGEWRCAKTGIRTKDGIDFYDTTGAVPTPDSLSYWVWTAYSPFTTWRTIVEDFYKAKGDQTSLKTFVNTTLGQTWEEETGEKLEWEELKRRREMPRGGDMPTWVIYLTLGIDTQDNRYEGRVWGWGADQECYLVHRFILHGDPDDPVLLSKVETQIKRSFTREDGLIMNIGVVCWDSGGHYTDTVYGMSKKLGVHKVVPVKGANVYGKPIANFPRKRNSKGVYLTEVGTDNAKELIMSRLKTQPLIDRRVPGAVHFPLNDEICDDTEFEQLTAERKITVQRDGKTLYRWDAGGRRNEALDCFVYALAALHIAISRFGLDLNKLATPQQSNEQTDTSPSEPEPQKKAAAKGNGWLNGVSGGWL